MSTWWLWMFTAFLNRPRFVVTDETASDQSSRDSKKWNIGRRHRCWRLRFARKKRGRGLKVSWKLWVSIKNRPWCVFFVRIPMGPRRCLSIPDCLQFMRNDDFFQLPVWDTYIVQRVILRSSIIGVFPYHGIPLWVSCGYSAWIVQIRRALQHLHVALREGPPDKTADRWGPEELWGLKAGNLCQIEFT